MARPDVTWVMDRGIPTEAVLAEMRSAETPTHYLVGTPRGRLSQMQQELHQGSCRIALRYRNDRVPCGADLTGPNHGKPPARSIIRRELRKTESASVDAAKPRSDACQGWRKVPLQARS